MSTGVIVASDEAGGAVIFRGAPDALARRLAGYDFFRALFLQDMSADLLRWLAGRIASGEPPPERNAPSWAQELTTYLRFDEQADNLDALADELRWEFNRLFIGPRKRIAPPYESAYRSSDGLLAQQPFQDVGHICAAWGLNIDPARGMAEDYVGYELEFMFYLLSLEAGAADLDRQRAERLQAAQREFLTEHLGRWLPRFCADVVSGTRSQLWRSIGGALRDFVYVEAQSALPASAQVG